MLILMQVKIYFFPPATVVSTWQIRFWNKVYCSNAWCRTYQSESGKTENVIHHTITVLLCLWWTYFTWGYYMTGYARRQNRANPEFWLASTTIKFFLFWELVFFSRFNPQEMNFFLFYVLYFFSFLFFLYVNRLRHRLADLIGSFSLMPYS